MKLTALYEQPNRKRSGSEWIAVLRTETSKGIIFQHVTLKAAPGNRQAAEREAAAL